MDRPSGGGLASVLAEHGLAVINVDFRAHGESDRPRRDLDGPTYDDLVLLDIPTLLAAARTLFPGLPLVIVGHSLGGHTSLIAAGLWPHRAPDALVMIAANLWLPRTEPSPGRRARKAASLTAFWAVTRAFGKFDAPRLRMGTDTESIGYVEQFVTFWKEDKLRSRDGSVDYDAALARARLPILAVASEGDTLLAHPEAMARFVGLASRSTVTHRIVHRGELGPLAPDHMGLVTSRESRPLWDEIARWILTAIT